MKKIIIILLLPFLSFAQSVIITPSAQGINTDSTRTNQLDVAGNGFTVQPKYNYAIIEPSENIYTMNCASTNNIFFQAGTLHDPSGPGNSYTSGIPYNCSFRIHANVQWGVIEINFSEFNTDNYGDSLIIYDSNSEVYGRFSGSTLPSKLLITCRDQYINFSFKTDADGNVGTGFTLTWKAILRSPAQSLNGFYGRGLAYDVDRNKFMVGNHAINQWNSAGFASIATGEHTVASGNASTAMGYNSKASGYTSMAMGRSSKAIGDYSAAMGYSSEASGFASMAMGHGTRADTTYATAMGRLTNASGYSSTSMGEDTEASGDNSTAMGHDTDASGKNSTAMGENTTASGNYSTALGRETQAVGINAIAMGYNTYAIGQYSTAMGRRTTANADYSTAMGNYVTTGTNSGSFIIGDNSTTTYFSPNGNNTFTTRFANGYSLYTNSGGTLGVRLLASANSWTTISDSTRKENFIHSNGEAVLNAVAQMRIGTWNYKTQDSKSNRHWGVMAQDFYKHFGHDVLGTIGNDTSIATADFDGVSFAAIKALEERTRRFSTSLELTNQKMATLEKTNAKLAEENKKLKTEMDDLREIVMGLVSSKNTSK